MAPSGPILLLSTLPKAGRVQEKRKCSAGHDVSWFFVDFSLEAGEGSAGLDTLAQRIDPLRCVGTHHPTKLIVDAAERVVGNAVSAEKWNVKGP